MQDKHKKMSGVDERRKASRQTSQLSPAVFDFLTRYGDIKRAGAIHKRQRRSHGDRSKSRRSLTAKQSSRQKVQDKLQRKEMEKAAFFRELCFGAHVAHTNPDVQHAFTDETHNMCCLLGPNSRAYADKSGNPIGKLSEEVAQTAPAAPKDTSLASWSTCLGSNVCSYYGQKFGDSYPKFAVSPDKKKMWVPTRGTIITPECAKFLQEDVFKGVLHETPGIKSSHSKHGCSVKDQAKILEDVIDTPF